MNRRAGMHAYIFSLLFAVGACGDKAPSPEAQPAPTASQQKPAVVGSESPIAGAQAALISDLSLDNSLDTLLDAAKYGAAEDPVAFTQGLLGSAAAGADQVQDLGIRLGAILADPDERTKMVAFEGWATEFYDLFGAVCSAAVEAGDA